MSWGEVKKINSDLSVSLDELIKNKTYPDKPFLTTGRISLGKFVAPQEVLNVKGAGRLHSIVFCYNSENAGVYDIAEVEIDGKTTSFYQQSNLSVTVPFCTMAYAFAYNANRFGVMSPISYAATRAGSSAVTSQFFDCAPLDEENVDSEGRIIVPGASICLVGNDRFLFNEYCKVRIGKTKAYSTGMACVQYELL